MVKTQNKKNYDRETARKRKKIVAVAVSGRLDGIGRLSLSCDGLALNLCRD